MLICRQASSPWWSSLSSASWCLWCGTCSATKAPTTPTRPRAQTRRIARMQRSSSATQPSPKPSRRARRSGSSDEPPSEPLVGRLLRNFTDNAAWVWKHRVPSRLISALFPNAEQPSRKSLANFGWMCFIWRISLSDFINLLIYLLICSSLFASHMVTADRFQHFLKFSLAQRFIHLF